MSDFIGVFENALTKEYCKTVIDHFNSVQTIHRSNHENISPLRKDTEMYFLNKETDKTIIDVNSFILAGFIEQLKILFLLPHHMYLNT